MKLKLTNRERKLLFILGVCLAAAVLYYAVIKPQLDMVSKLERQAEEYSITIERTKDKANPENSKYREYDELYSNTQTLLKSFYPSIIQEKIVLMLEDKIKISNINVKDITFSEPSLAEMQAEKVEQATQNDELEALTEQIKNDVKAVTNKKTNTAVAQKNPLLLEKMTVNINFTGSYSQIYNFINAIEQEKRSITCSNLSIESKDAGLLTGNLTMNIYSIPKPFLQDEDYLNWDIDGNYGSANPFGSVQSVKSIMKP